MITAINSTRSIISNANSANRNLNANKQHNKSKANVSFGLGPEAILALPFLIGLAVVVALFADAVSECRQANAQAKKAEKAELSALTRNGGRFKLFNGIKKL